MSLLEGCVLSLYAVALLATTVCAFKSPKPPPISPQLRDWTERIFVIVLVLSVVFVAISLTSNILDTFSFGTAQILLALIALPFSWAARA